tara:strand:- start:199 stop:729 length:531 start_codon:yes stop_codon:yes gene_type:complete
MYAFIRMSMPEMSGEEIARLVNKRFIKNFNIEGMREFKSYVRGLYNGALQSMVSAMDKVKKNFPLTDQQAQEFFYRFLIDEKQHGSKAHGKLMGNIPHAREYFREEASVGFLRKGGKKGEPDYERELRLYRQVFVAMEIEGLKELGVALRSIRGDFRTEEEKEEAEMMGEEFDFRV